MSGVGRHLTVVRCTGCGGDHADAEIRVDDPSGGPYFLCGGRRVYLVPRGTPAGTQRDRLLPSTPTPVSLVEPGGRGRGVGSTPPPGIVEERDVRGDDSHAPTSGSRRGHSHPPTHTPRTAAGTPHGETRRREVQVW